MSLSKHRLALATGLPHMLNWCYRRRLLVVTYHGLYNGPEGDNRYPDTFVHVDRMSAQLRFLKKYYLVLRPDDVLTAISERTSLPDYSALVTFDDGYANFESLAVPVLKQLDIQPIVFIPTSYIETQKPFWYDLVWFFFHHAPTLKRQYLSQKNEIPLQDKESLKNFLSFLKKMDRAARESIIKEIQTEIDQNGLNQGMTSEFKALTSDQLRELSRQGICFGGHTHSHTIMTSMTDEDARDEILLNKSQLEHWLEGPVHFFAYPNGGESDFNDKHKKILSSAGYTGAFSLTQRRSCHLEDPMGISRLHIPPEDNSESFKLRCTGTVQWIKGIRSAIQRNNG